jgi:hypothetical protein
MEHDRCDCPGCEHERVIEEYGDLLQLADEAFNRIIEERDTPAFHYLMQYLAAGAHTAHECLKAKVTH